MSLRRSQASGEIPQAAPVDGPRKSVLSNFWSRHKESVLCCAVLLVCLFVVRLVFLEAPCHRGDTNYMVIASNYSPQLLKDAPDQIYFRSGMILPFIVLEGLFGYNLTTYYVFSLTAYALVLCGVFLVARQVGDLTTAVIATCLAGTSALFLSRSSNPFPDTPNLAFMLFSFAFFMRAIRVQSGSAGAVVAAATCAFVAYLFRAPNLLWLGCIPVYELLQTRSLKRTLLFSAVFALLLGAECLYYLVLIGDPLIRFRMIFGACSAWSGNMPFISLRQYLLEPFTEILASAAGWILLLGFVPGLVMAVRKRNWPLVGLVAGALVIFGAYSYALSSTDPLRRALPLQHRYIMAFTAVLAITTGYLLAQLRNWTEARALGPAFRLLVPLFVGCLLVFQLRDLPDTIGRQALFLGKDRFFFADRVLNAKEDTDLAASTIYAAPVRPFTLYPRFRTLKLEQMPLYQAPKPGQTLLYSRRYLHRQVATSSLPHRAKDPVWQQKVKWLEYYLQYPPPAHWEYLVNTGDIVMVRVGTPRPQWQVGVDLTDPALHETAWTTTCENGHTDSVKTYSQERALVFEVAPTDLKSVFLYTFAGPWNRPADEWAATVASLHEQSAISCDIRFSVDQHVRVLTMTLVEYDDRQQLCSTTYHLPRNKGTYELSKPIVLNDETVSFRAILKIVTDLNTKLVLHRFHVCVPPEDEACLADTPTRAERAGEESARKLVAQGFDVNPRR